MNITFIGGGNMACALVGGLLRQGYPTARLRVVEISAAGRDKIEREFAVSALAEPADGVNGSDVILLAVKPQKLPPVARQLAPLLRDQLVISIAAGIRATDLRRWLGGHARVVRAMPNTPALVRAAVTGLYALPEVSAPQKQQAETILAAVGSVLWLEREELLDAVTAVSGSGPAYVFYFIEALQQAAQELGLDAAQARQLGLETFLGAATLASDSKEDAAVLRARVTSRGGTTERALQSMEHDAVKQEIVRAIHAASARARELADEFGRQ